MLDKVKNIIYQSFPGFTIRDGRPISDWLLKPNAALNEQFEAEKQSFVDKAYIVNHVNMTPTEFDAIMSNYLNTRRKIGRFCIGNVRIYLSQRTDIVFDQTRASFEDSAGKGKRFIPRFDFAVSVENLKFDDKTSEYYIDILVMSEQPFGSEILIKKGEIDKYLGANPFVKRIVNTEDFVLVDVQESNSELYTRVKENGIVLNSTRNNYLGNLVYQNFPDIRKMVVAGNNHSLMKRDLTFNSIDASYAVTNYNFFRKRKGSTVDNKSSVFKGLLFSNSKDLIDFPDSLVSLFSEIEQDEYESIAFKDKGSMSVSSLVLDNIFALYGGINDFAIDNWTSTENNKEWNKGSSYLTFTNDINQGIEIKGEYVKDPLIANGDRGLVIYKEIGDVRNTEFMLTFSIEDFKTIVNQEDSINQTNSNNETEITISNNNPLYFTVLKRGLKDQDDTFRASTIDGYGVMIMKSFPDRRPNVFIIDGSSAIGSMAFEEQIMALGSERILSLKEVPLEAGVKYNCIMQINDNYGMNVIIKNEFDAEVGRLSVGSGPDLPEYMTTYTSQTREELKQKVDVTTDTNPPKIFGFLSEGEEDINKASSILDLSFLVATGTTSPYLVKNYGESRRIVYLDTSNPVTFFTDFNALAVGDSIEILKQTYTVVNKYSHTQIELDRDVPNLSNGTSWRAWKNLILNEDYTRPNSANFVSFILLKNGIEKIIEFVNLSKTSVVLKLIYINGKGEVLTTELGFINGVDMKPYDAPVSPDPTSIDLDSVHIFDNSLTSGTDYFINSPGITKFNSLYLTQGGFNKVKSSHIKISCEDSVDENFILKLSDYNAGYYLPIQYGPGVDKVTFINKIYLKNSGYALAKGTHYSVIGNVITDILVSPTYYNLFNSAIEYEAEVVGTGTYQNVESVASSQGNNKIYISTGSISTTDYFSVYIEGERYFINSINLTATSPYPDKLIEITVDKNVPILSNKTCDVRKKYISSLSPNALKFGYRYSIEAPSSLKTWDTGSTTTSISYGSRNLVKGLDFEADRKVPIVKYYISNDLFEDLVNEDYLVFVSKYREIVEEAKYTKYLEFKPLSNGSYLGIGFKSISNAQWNITQLRIRKLLDRYSSLLIQSVVGDKPVTNEDRVKIDLTSYAVNVNSQAPSNGVLLYIYNYLTSEWEKLYENNSASQEDGSRILQFYDGTDETLKYNFGYWYGSTFITLNEAFYPTSYVSRNGTFTMLLISKGKNEKNFTGDILFGEAKLFLDYINLNWQRKSGIHLGNKMDIWIASESKTTTEDVTITLTDSVKEFTLDSNFKYPIKKINSITLSPQEIPIGFSFSNEDPNLRYSTKENLKVTFTNPVSPGTYIFNYEYYPHVAVKQTYVDSLQYHIDSLIRQLVPVDVGITLEYSGNMNVNTAKDLIYNYIRFNNFLDMDVVFNLMEKSGASSIRLSDTTPPIKIEEYDLENDVIKQELNFSYILKPEKYFEISKDNINLIKV